jgi:SPOR domain
MARSNGPFGPPGTRAPLRRNPADDPFAPPPPAQPNGQWPTQPGYADQHAAQPGQGFHFPPEPDANFGYNQQHLAQQQAPQQPQQWGQQPDPRGYDLGSYMPPGAQPYPVADPAPFHQQHQAPYGGQAYGGQQQGYAEQDAYDDDFVDEDDEPRRGRRWLLIVAALVGAIGVGGALAYTYKAIIAPNGGRVPWVKAGDPNVKVKAENRGSKETAAADKRSLTRLADDAAQKGSAESQEGEDGPKRVKTIAIPLGGGPAAAEEPPAPAVVPGIMLDNVPPRGKPTPGQPPKVVVPAPQPPPEIEEAQPPPARRPPVHVPAVAAKPPPPPAPPAKAKEPPAVVATTGAGYVAVLSSQKTRMDALKVFADMQQKYDVLANKTPDVQEADLSARGLGTMYRLVVGPPGSRDAASGVCSQLKTAGYVGCWVTEY